MRHTIVIFSYIFSQREFGFLPFDDSLFSLRYVLDNHSNTLPATNTGRTDAVLEMMAAQLIYQGDGDTSPRCRQGMTRGGGAAIDIGLVAIQGQFLLDGQRLCRGRLVDVTMVRLVYDRVGLF